MKVRFYFSIKGLVSCLGYLLAALHSGAVAQPEDRYHVQHFTDENGLPQNSVKGMVVGNSGFVWLLTEAGLVRFDGRKMKVFNQETLLTLSDRMHRFTEDLQTGKLYAINEMKQYIRIENGHAHYDTTYHPENALNDPIPGVLEPKELENFSVVEDSYQAESRVVAAGERGQYFLYANQKIFFYRNGKLEGKTPFLGMGYFQPFPFEYNVRKLFIAKNRRAIFVENFLGINGTLFYHQNSEGDRFTKITTEGTATLSLSGDIEKDPAFPGDRNHIRIFHNRLQRQVFAYLGHNIYRVTFSKKYNRLNTELLAEGFNLDAMLVSNILYHEPDRMLFLGSIAHGVTLVKRKTFQVLKDFNQVDFHNVYYAQIPYGRSSIVTPGGLILGTEQAYPMVQKAMKGDGERERLTLLRDKNKAIWVKEGKFIFQLDPDGKLIMRTIRVEHEPMKLYQGVGEELWVGCMSGQLYQMNKGSDLLKLVTKVPSQITYIYQTQHDQILIGTNAGLFLYHLNTKKLVEISRLKQKNIRSIYTSRPGVTWVTTYGSGIFGIFGQRVVPMPGDANNYLNYSHCILEDKQGRFWITTNKGLFMTRENDLLNYAKRKTSFVHYAYYDKTSGFLSNEFNGGCQPCAVKLEDGHFSFPSMNGLVWMKPDSTPEPFIDSPFVIENMHVDDKQMELRDTIHLPHDFKFLAFDLSTPMFANYANLQFLYSVKKAGTTDPVKWTETDGNQPINVYNLPAGEYLLAIRKITGLGGKYREKKLLIIISKAWYRTWEFLLFATLASMMTFWLYTRWRLERLTQQNTLLSEKVDERTHHLSKALEDLRVSDEALQTQLQIQLRIIGIINHDVHSPLRYLNSAIPTFFKTIEPYFPDKDALKYSEAISKSTEKVYKLTDDLLNFIKATQKSANQIVYESVDLLHVLETKAAFFAEIAAESETVLRVVPSEPLHVQTNRMMLEIIIHNLIDNALKHVYRGTVTLSANQGQDDTISVRISDTGYGMSPEIVKWLNTTSKDSSGDQLQTSVPPNLGLGFIIVKEIVEILKIGIGAGADDNGTIIDLYF